MKRRPWSFLTISLLGGAAVAVAPAQATPFVGMLPAALALQSVLPTQPCRAPSPFTEPALRAEKTAALLGGAPSRLQQILQQQAQSAPVQPALARPAPMAMPCAPAQPAEASFASQPVAQPAPLSAPIIAAIQPGQFLASQRLRVSRTTFDAQWHRVSAAGLGKGALRGLALPPGQASLEQRLLAVNAWANTHVRFQDDAVLYGRADYWASASETLRRRAGDCEDIAILKLQMLAALGLPRADMFLTVARDLARHADHALLVVRDGNRFWLLDNATNALVDATQANDYAPIFSYSQGGAWLHGATIAAPRLALAVATPAPAANPPLLDSPSAPLVLSQGNAPLTASAIIAQADLAALPDLGTAPRSAWPRLSVR